MQEIQFIAPVALHDEMLRLRNEKQMDFLESLTGMDWGAADEKDTPEKLRGLGVVYHLESTVTGERIAVKTATTNRELPEIPSVSDIWKIADFYEREVFDYYGITFIGHPDMRRLYLRNDWIGYPMRKDNDPEKDNPLCMTNEETFDTTREIELNPDGTIKDKETKLFGEEEYVVNIGPQHPATHGVMRFRVSLEGEIIRKIDANCGYIHRGIEKMNESLTYPQTLALTDRLDYLGAHQNRHALCMCIEKAMGVEVSERVQYIRTIMDELQRIDSHLLFFSALAMDLGALTAFFYGFRDREKILDIFEETCGGRLIMNYNTIGGVQADLHPNFVKRVKEFIPYMRGIIHEYHDIFTGNVPFGLEYSIQFLECSTGFQNFSLDRILSHDDTAGGIDFGIAGMDQDAEEMRHIMQIWHFLLVPGTVLKSDFISPGRNGSLGIDLFLAGTGTAARSIRTGCRKFPHGIFDGITEKFAVDGQVTYGIGLTFEFAVECQLHTSILFVSKE